MNIKVYLMKVKSLNFNKQTRLAELKKETKSWASSFTPSSDKNNSYDVNRIDSDLRSFLIEF